MTESVRLAKRLAEQIACSRRDAEQYIEGGWVKVDGEMVEEPGYRVQLQQQIELMADATLTPNAPVTILLHKPVGCESSVLQSIVPEMRAADDRSGIRFLKRHVLSLKLTDSLAANVSGLVVFTEDWRIARKLINDVAKIEQEYIVEVIGELAPDGLALLNQGLNFNGKALAPIKVSWQNENRLRFALKSEKPEQIAFMCEAVGLSVLAIKRIRIGRIPMTGLQPGQWRYLLGYERF
jgi:23S rRNA pseudouridine2604 synthase